MTKHPIPRVVPPVHAVSRGFTLIEVMVAIIVIAVSVLGLAAMLGRVHTNAYGALLRTDASILLTDMAERVMANRATVMNPLTTATYQAAIDTDPDCANKPAAAATATAVAALDLWEFRCMAKQSLPAGKGSVVPDAAIPPANVIITVQWDDSRGGSGNGNDGKGRTTQTLTQVVNLK
jgi:type IV pilus assembly protein PilV